MTAQQITDDDTGEVARIDPAGAKPVPRIKSLDALIARANGGEYRDEMPEIIERFFGNLFNFAIDNDLLAKGTLNIAIKAEVDRFGDVSFDVKPKIELPSPPATAGKGRAFIEPDGALFTHPQRDAPLFRDVSKPPKTMRDPHANKPHTNEKG